MMRKLNVLVGCESSGVVRRAFRAMGHNAWSCDLLPADDASPYHLNFDVRKAVRHGPGSYLWTGWDLAIFHPPCTRLCNSGVRWLSERNLWNELDEAADLFSFCLNAPIPMVAVENPVMHKHAKERIGGYVEFTQSIQPWQFGHGEVKRTCLWLKNLPSLEPTEIVDGREARIHKMPPSKDRWKQRSKTYEGVANAMAIQWSAWAERAGQ